MIFLDIIKKKKHNIELSKEEIKWVIDEYVKGSIIDYQFSALLMAIWFNGMTKDELFYWTKAYIESGSVYDVSKIKDFKVDKHSTGGVGDKTSMVFSPLVSLFGLKVCKLSGRGLGQTGGTIDKLESFPGWTSELDSEKFIDVIKKTGMSLCSQSSNIVPADKKIYSLRDVTGTVDSIHLIAASIMSKKLVIENNCLIIDLKLGDGSFVKDLNQAEKLSNLMIDIARNYNREIVVLITDMDKPLGKAIGNALEVREAIETLKGNGPKDLVELVSTAVAICLIKSKKFNDLNSAKKAVLEKMNSGEAVEIFKSFIKEQGGDYSVIENYEKNFIVKHKIEIKAQKSGYIKYKNCETLGILSMRLGAGRKTKEDIIDHSAGIYLNKECGEYIEKGEVVMTLYTNKDIESDWVDVANLTYDILEKEIKSNVIIKIIDRK